MAILTSPRRFQVWTYLVSHSQLLLRSTKEDGYSTRVDVLFRDVVWVSFPTLFDGLKICEGAWPSWIPEDLKEGRKSFQILSQEVSCFVVSGSVTVLEDEGAFHEPSALILALPAIATTQ